MKSTREDVHLTKFARDLVSSIVVFDAANKPGAFIKRLSKEKLELVKQLKSKHFNHRMK